MPEIPREKRKFVKRDTVAGNFWPIANYYDAIDETFSYEDLDYTVIEMGGVEVRVATIETLIKLKKGTVREIDRLDVAMLEAKLEGET